jgi:hypothetical protein
VVPPCSDRIARVPPYSRTEDFVSRTGLSPALARLSRRFWYAIFGHWPGPRSLATTNGVSLMSFPPATEMFQFAGFASRPYEFRSGYRMRGGFPHSEIPGSKSARLSSGLIAACYVLHRLLAPRHPPNALIITLDRNTRHPQGQAPRTTVSREDTLFS